LCGFKEFSPAALDHYPSSPAKRRIGRLWTRKPSSDCPEALLKKIGEFVDIDLFDVLQAAHQVSRSLFFGVDVLFRLKN